MNSRVNFENYEFFRFVQGFSEVLLSVFTFWKMFFSYRTLPRVTIVTAADASHERSLMQLIKSVETHEKGLRIYLYDLGLSDLFFVNLKKYQPELEIFLVAFDFSLFPDWMKLSNEDHGAYAWKPIIIRDVAAEMLKSKGEGTLLWLDAGDKVIAPLDRLNRFTYCYGFWATRSWGDISRWVHPKLLELFDFPKGKFGYPCLNAAALSFSLTSESALTLLNSWANYAALREYIAPLGSNLSNHRYDQSLLTLLSHQNDMFPSKRAGLIAKNTLLFHQDIDHFFSF